MTATRYTEVAVTLPVAGRYHYRVPAHLAARAQIGARVLVRFGPRKVTGVVVRTETSPPEGVSVIDLTEVLDEDVPALPPELVELCLWVADYYEAPPGEVMRAALPAGSGVAARAVIALTEAGRAAADGAGSALPAKQRAMLARLAGGTMPAAGLTPAARHVIDALVNAGLAEKRDQRANARTKLKTERVAKLRVSVDDARAAVGRAKKRLAVVEELATGGVMALEALERRVPGAKTCVRELVKQGLVEVGERELSLEAVATGADMHVSAPPVLTDEQAVAVAEITAALRGEPPVESGGPRARSGPAATALAPATDTAATAAVSTTMAMTAAASAPDPHAPTAPASAPISTAMAPTAATASAPASTAMAATAGANDLATAATVTAPVSTVTAMPVAALNDAAGTATVAIATAAVSTAMPPTAIATAAASNDAAGPETVALANGAAPRARVPAARAPKPFLLHGVTGSGKTEVYLRVIAEALAAGKTALVLVPEISLTPQLAARFRARFGDQVAILHSGLSEQARLGEWSRLRRGEASIAVGARSAVFAPLRALGVIVVDEEHDGSFKQEEGVRYHARDVALVRAQRAGAVCVLGSATPSLESAAHAERGTYRKLVLTQRPTARPMPEVEVIDLRTYQPDGESMLSAPLHEAIGETLAAGNQAILFLNRRGFATFVLCKGCGFSFRCTHCAVSLTYHRHSDRLSCHYCGFQMRVPEACPSCSAVGTIERKGLGTERIAAAVTEAFPTARVARLDRDVASGAKVEAVLARVARREVDILVGTQMVTKGHDFPGVTLVGVLCADTGLSLPDFRASERTFQLLAQVAGRAGRGDRPGRVLVQTYRPTAAAVVAAAAHDYAQFFTSEMAARAELGYPPHGRLIAIRIDGAEAPEVASVAERLAKAATTLAGRADVGGTVEILGPVPAPLERLRGRTRWQIWLRGPDRQALRRVARGTLATEVASAVRVGLDVDPISTL